jgi:hypothetical protein
LGVDESTRAGKETFPILKIKCTIGIIKFKCLHYGVKFYLKLQLTEIALASGTGVISSGFESVGVDVENCQIIFEIAENQSIRAWMCDRLHIDAVKS